MQWLPCRTIRLPPGTLMRAVPALHCVPSGPEATVKATSNTSVPVDNATDTMVQEAHGTSFASSPAVQLPELADDILESILITLGPSDILSVAQSCKRLHAVSTSEPLWSALCSHTWGRQTPVSNWISQPSATAASSSSSINSGVQRQHELVPVTFR